MAFASTVILNLALILAVLTTSAHADSQIDVRYLVSSSHVNTTSYSALFEAPLVGEITGEAGVRLSTSLTDLQVLQYKGEVSYAPLSFFRLALRLHHANRMQETTSTSHLLATAGLDGNIIGPLGAFFTVGWYERFSRLNRPLVVPTFNGGRREHDIAVTMGFRVQATEQLSSVFTVATIDEIEIHNLNNPFMEGRLEYGLPDVEGHAFLFFRYKLLLGFGRWDELIGGAGLRLPLTALAGSDS